MPDIPQTTFYVASRSFRFPMWVEWKARGYNIISSWIDLEGQKDWLEEEWGVRSQMCLEEAAKADCLILYAEVGDELRGAYMEIGSVLLAGREVRAVLEEGFETTAIFLPHPKVFLFPTLESAFNTPLSQ